MAQREKKTRKLLVITNCTAQCPHVVKVHTPGSGYAQDYLCRKARKKNGEYRLIAGYVEWDSELPKDGEFPKWCPLFEAEPGMYE